VHRPKLDRNLALVTVAIVAIILHGSLYPYAFRVPSGAGNPVATLIGTWAMPPRSFGDLVANVLLYVPFGLLTALALGRDARIWLVTLAGLALCTGIEVLQFYDQGRVSNASDIYLNTVGTLAGAVAARGLESRGSPHWPAKRLNAAPCLLIAAFFGWRLYPYVPMIDLHKYWSSLKPVLLHPDVQVPAALRYFALWLTTSYLVTSTVRQRIPPLIPLFAAFVIGAKILIVNQSISPSEIVGAGLGAAVWLLALQERRWAPFVVWCILCAAVIAQRLQPFHFVASQHEFGWLPFRGFLQGSLGANIQSFFEKLFLYGSLIWVAAVAGVRLWLATAGIAALLFLTSVAETYLPGRSGEVTDAVMVLAIGMVIAALRPEQGSCSPAQPVDCLLRP